GHKPPTYDSWGYPNASRYIRKLQSRRSLLMWKVYGKRLDGFNNEDHPSEPTPGAGHLIHKGEKVERRNYYDIDFVGKQMPPAEAITGTYKSPQGNIIKVEPLTDEDKRTLARWIDLGCPIDLDYDSINPEERGYGWMLDDSRPVLNLTYPKAGLNKTLNQILIGMTDYYTGLDPDSFTVIANFEIESKPAGENISFLFKTNTDQVWQLKLSEPIKQLKAGKITVSVKDHQGNISKIVRSFVVGEQ
ncbi:MAG: hypothetical protein N2B02_06090, partial [Amylibacter sp.]